MTKATYFLTGISAALMAFSVSGAPAIADDGENCFQNRGGFQWNVCGEKARRAPNAMPAVAAAPAPAAPAEEPVQRPRGIFSTFLPNAEIDYEPSYPGDGVGGSDGGRGDGAGDR